MNYCLHRAIIICILFFFGGHTYAQPDTAVSESAKHSLDALRQQDDLENWIYTRIEYVDGDPAARLDFLMNTQRESWRGYKTYYERIAWFNLLATQGYYQLQVGNILASIAAYENALQFYTSYPLPDADVAEYVLKPLGNNYTRLADYNTALFIHQKTLAEVTKSGDRNAIASVYSNMAACSRWKGDLEQAENFCRRGIEYVDKKRLLYGLLLSTYADILSEQKKFDTAAKVCNQSIEKLKYFGNDMQALYWYTSALQIASRIAAQRGEYTSALHHANTALELFNKYFPNLRQREKAKLYVSIGDVMQKTGRYDESLTYYHNALMFLLPDIDKSSLSEIPPAENLYSENTFGDIFYGKAAVFEKQGRSLDAMKHYLACFAAERKLRAAFFYDESKLRELQVNRPRVQAAMRLAWQNRKSGGDKIYASYMLQIAEQSKAQLLSDERNGRLVPTATQQNADTLYKRMRYLQEAINYYQREQVSASDKKKITALLQSAEYELAQLTRKMKTRDDESRTDLNDILKALPAHVSVLEFFEGEDSSFVIVVDAGGIQSIRAIAGSRELGTAIQQFRSRWFQNAGAMQNKPGKFYESSYALYQSIFGNYSWKKDQRYIIIPDGLFNYLPFDALITEGNYRVNIGEWPWLLKQASYSRAWSLQTWHQQQSAKYDAGAFSAFFVGNDKAGANAKLSVEKEYNSLQSLVRGEYFVNTSATWQQFNEAADTAGVLHIGSHAMMTSGDSVPFLQLYDKPFYLFDLRYKKFSPSLVVLGACKTADGLLLKGEGINSLSRGFTAAGAGGVISGLWNVNDETAIAFMEIFYKKLRHHDAASALQEAKLQWLKEHNDNAALQMPYYWSGFIYSGHLQLVALEERGSNWWWYIIIGLAVVLPAMAYRFFLWRRSVNDSHTIS